MAGLKSFVISSSRLFRHCLSPSFEYQSHVHSHPNHCKFILNSIGPSSIAWSVTSDIQTLIFEVGESVIE